MDASHLIVENRSAAFVDTGTTHSVPYLLAALESQGLAVNDVEYVMLTHIHLDHAGGAGALMQHLPEAKAVVHPRGARHMADPGKLISGTIAVYGETLYKELYGEIVPIPEDRLIIANDGDRLQFGAREFELIHTSGHAKHHYCIVDSESDAVFTGDSFGLSYREFDTDKGPFIFPTTTPIHFDPDAAHASIDRIVSYEPEAVFLTHYSRVEYVQRLAGDLHECLDEFVRIAEGASRENPKASITFEMREYLLQRLRLHGYEGSNDEARVILDPDVELNTQGLLFWLEHRER